MDTAITKLYQSPRTVLTTKDLALIWQENDQDNLKSKVSYYVKRGVLVRLTRGVYAKSKAYEPKELATSIYMPSYVSFETVLREAGVIFQHQNATFVASSYSTTRQIDDKTFVFRKLKDEILYNPLGIDNRGDYSIASKERALLDMLYVSPKFYFDNLGVIDWDECERLVPLYDNKQLANRLAIYRKNYDE